MSRSIIVASIWLLAGVCLAQTKEGIYKPTNSSPVPWSINDHQCLIWAGQPYLPYGIRVDGNPTAVTAAKAAGITDLIVDVPANGSGWDQVLATLSGTNLRYLLRINSLAPMAQGFAVEPQNYRITGLTESKDVTVEIPGASSALVVLVAKSNVNIISSARVPVVNGKLTFPVKIGPQIEHVLLVYPEMSSLDQPDYWEGFDSQRDELLSSLKRHPLGLGLRGIVDPTGHRETSPSNLPKFVPTSPTFRMEFSRYLEDKYKNVLALLKAWSMSSSSLSQMDDIKKQWLTTFPRLSHLVPLWSANRGVPAMYDPDTNQTYPCDSKYSEAWNDIAQVINAAGERRFAHLVPAIHTVVDVPVIQEWSGWVPPCETKRPMLDGIGMKAYGTTQSSLSDSGSRATSSIMRWNTSGWLVATEVDPGSDKNLTTELPNVIDDVTSMGAKGVFIRTDSATVIKALAAEAKQRSNDNSSANSSPLPLYFPENAYNPAVPQRLPGDHWWLPTPSDGNRIDLGSMFFAYRSGLNDGAFSLWTKRPGRYKLRMTHSKSVTFKTLDGSDPLPKFSKDGVELQLTEVPLLISGTMEVPIPELALLETVQRFTRLVTAAETAKKPIDEQQLYFSEASNGFERNPGGSFEQMRKEYWKLVAKVAPYTWIEGEKAVETNFSEIIAKPGCSGGSALSLKTQFNPGTAGYYADYSFPVKTKEDQDIWIAAKIPADRRNDVTIVIGGQILHLTGDPVSLYGGGFGWYKAGNTRFGGTIGKFRIQVNSFGGGEIAIDAILVTPNPFTPNAVTPPDPIDFGALLVTPSKKKRKGSGGS